MKDAPGAFHFDVKYVLHSIYAENFKTRLSFTVSGFLDIQILFIASLCKSLWSIEKLSEHFILSFTER